MLILAFSEEKMNFYDVYKKGVKSLDDYFDGNPTRWTVQDENSKYFGTFASFQMLPDTADVGYVTLAVTAYCCPDSKYYKSKRMLEYITHYSNAIVSKLNEDGTNTMFASNFRTGEQFGLEKLSYHALIMRKCLSGDKDEKEAYDALIHATSRFADGCLASGFHTPNHRWVESAGLVTAYELTKKEAYLEKAKKYLAEGVDCDEYGEWSERSAGVYNEHCDRVFLQIYHIMKNEEYLDAVCRNLELMRYYIDSDFSMFTQNSRRKDKGEVGSVPMFFKATKYYADPYIVLYLLAGYLKNDAKFATVARKIYENSLRRGGGYVFVSDFLLYPELKTWEFEEVADAIPSHYEIYQPKSNIVRKRDGGVIWSFFAKNPSFLQIEAAGINAQVRLCSSFFAVAQFFPQALEKTDRGYKLCMTAHGEYKLPLDNPDGVTTKDYWSIDYSARRAIQQQDLEMSVEAVFVPDGVELEFDVHGCDRVPTKVEIALNPGLLCEIGDTALITSAGASIFGKEGAARFESPAGDVMTVDGLFCRHMYAVDMRGSLDPVSGAFTLYLTDFAPIKKKVKITIEKAKGTRMFI